MKYLLVTTVINTIFPEIHMCKLKTRDPLDLQLRTPLQIIKSVDMLLPDMRSPKLTLHFVLMIALLKKGEIPNPKFPLMVDTITMLCNCADLPQHTELVAKPS